MFQRILAICTLAAAAAFSQDAGSLKAAAATIGEVKQSLAKNKAQLRQYTWTETTEINLKGEEKKRTQAACQYGPDGNMQKTAIGEAPPPKNRRGIKGKIITKKIDEMKDYMDRVVSLVRRYVPPDPQGLQAAFEAGKATLNPVSGVLVFSDYAKPGDSITVTFNMATKKLSSLAVATYLDQPNDVVTVNARFSSLPDGTNFVEESVLNATAKQIQITTTNFGYHRASL